MSEQRDPTTARVMLDYVRSITSRDDLESADVVSNIRQMFDQGTADGQPFPRSFAEMKSSGLLWFINSEFLHPRGWAFAIDFDADGVALGWLLLKSADGVWEFDYEPGEREALQQKADALFEASR